MSCILEQAEDPLGPAWRPPTAPRAGAAPLPWAGGGSGGEGELRAAVGMQQQPLHEQHQQEQQGQGGAVGGARQGPMDEPPVWWQAEEPFQFLATIFEIRNALESGKGLFEVEGSPG